MKLIEKIKNFIKPTQKTRTHTERFQTIVESLDSTLSAQEGHISKIYRMLFQCLVAHGRLKTKEGHILHFEIETRDGFHMPKRIEKGLAEYIQRVYRDCDVTFFRDEDNILFLRSVEITDKESDKSGKDEEMIDVENGKDEVKDLLENMRRRLETAKWDASQCRNIGLASKWLLNAVEECMQMIHVYSRKHDETSDKSGKDGEDK